VSLKAICQNMIYSPLSDNSAYSQQSLI